MLKTCDINIRDPFVLNDNGKFYMYGTRARDFGCGVQGFDVYVSDDLENWSEPIVCFDSVKNGCNRCVNWAPEVHKYNGSYYMLATFTKENDLRGTYALKADSPLGPFEMHSNGALTPYEWEALDGTLYVEDGTPYLVFCHEHTQIIDGTVCYIELSEDLTEAFGEPVTLFNGSSPYWADKKPQGEHYITDGPFMYRTANGTLLMIWSTFIKGKYAECVVRFTHGSIKGELEHLAPIIDDDGGHGMIFNVEDRIYLTFHTPNQTNYERPKFIELVDNGSTIEKK